MNEFLFDGKTKAVLEFTFPGNPEPTRLEFIPRLVNIETTRHETSYGGNPVHTTLTHVITIQTLSGITNPELKP